MAQSQKTSDPNVVYAFEGDQSLKDLIGRSTRLSDIFTQEKIDACQKMVDDARSSFFDSVLCDLDIIRVLAAQKTTPENFAQLRKGLFQPLSNIKGQAELFNFTLITRVCQYLMEYCACAPSDQRRQTRDAFIIIKLVDILQKTIREKILDSEGMIEKELIAIVEMARK